MTDGTSTVMFVSFPGPTPSERVPHPQTVDGPLSQSNTASGLDDFDEEGLPPMGGQDFGSMIRDKILGEHNKKDSITEFEVRGQRSADANISSTSNRHAYQYGLTCT